jgi:prevent-host-death family protein
MKEWQFRETKTKFSKVVDSALKGETQLITQRGKKVAVVLSY